MASLHGDMCPQKYYSITKSRNRSFMLIDAENDANTEVIGADMINNNEKLLKHPNFAPTLSGA
jgi:hypothetical protein